MDCINFSFEGENLCDISWAAKNYACSFCKREFRSAQALGGHMNVHRRDRARLRLLPPSLSSEICPHNPNPSSYFSPSSSSSSSSLSSSKGLPHNYSSCHSLLSPSLRALMSATSSTDGNKKPKFKYNSPQNHVPNLIPKKGKRGAVDHEAGEILKGFAQKDLDDEFNKVDDLKKESNIIRLDLDMGFFKDHKEEVDLELRLGHL
ncbi:hypothetical protein PRUPE_8G228000 [Prunus persica]|uniref:C2H2-type domain-containing protein n=1 Tax=Prunus persica TaxID=3760 RepID=M5VLU7_PRUPE|nr:transcriptional regulator SUPERMAN [Prunus persica]ONH93351.1 hypothetical protein PRUPE_8G228000 [Prunus persica]ONH93352.1 hypothetical protein PRUPE_8G228000 [Prunus persica]